MHMNTPLISKLALLLLAVGIGSNAAASGAATPAAGAKLLPVEAFFKKPALGSPKLSPSGKRIAMLVPNANGRIGLAIADVATPNKFTGIAQFDDADIANATWVNDERLV